MLCALFIATQEKDSWKRILTFPTVCFVTAYDQFFYLNTTGSSINGIFTTINGKDAS